MKWFKFYGQDWLTDIKVINLSPIDRLCFITMLCLASSSEDNGKIKNCDEDTIIRLTQLRSNPYDEKTCEVTQAVGVIKRLHDNGMITSDNAGSVSLKNFVQRQGENLTSYERVKRYREKKNKAKNMGNIAKKKVIKDNIERVINDNARREENRREENIHISEASSEDIVSVIDAFKVVNPAYKKWFARNPMREACDRLIKANTKEKVLKVIAMLPKTNTMKFFPNIQTPIQLEDRWSALETAYFRKLSETKNNNVI